LILYGLFTLIRFIRKNPVVLAVPILSVVVVLATVFVMDISLLALLGIVLVANLLVVFLCVRLSATREARLQSVFFARERECYLAQSHLMQGYQDSIKPYSFTGNVVFDSIINYKFRNAERENIKLDIRQNILKSLNVETADLALILCNVLDNALDGVARVQEKRIKFRAEFDRGVLLIVVENPFDGVVKFAKDANLRETKSWRKPLPATRKEGCGHGRGLQNVRRSLDKYDGMLYTEIKGDVFSLTLMLYASFKVDPVLRTPSATAMI